MYGVVLAAFSSALIELSGISYPVLALRVITFRMEAYRACVTSHSPHGGLQGFFYELLSEWKLTELALHVSLQKETH